LWHLFYVILQKNREVASNFKRTKKLYTPIAGTFVGLGGTVLGCVTGAVGGWVGGSLASLVIALW